MYDFKSISRRNVTTSSYDTVRFVNDMGQYCIYLLKELLGMDLQSGSMLTAKSAKS